MGQRFQAIAILSKNDFFEQPRLAFHHQWMYGATVVNVGLSVLDYVKRDRRRSSPLQTRFAEVTPAQDLLGVLNLVYRGCQRRERYTERWLDTSDERTPHDFTMGDNNDGVLILDLREFRKPRYCYVLHRSLGKANPFHPVDAATYMAAYYPEAFDKPQEERWRESVLRQFAKYPVLTKKELRELFPEMTTKKS